MCILDVSSVLHQSELVQRTVARHRPSPYPLDLGAYSSAPSSHSSSPVPFDNDSTTSSTRRRQRGATTKYTKDEMKYIKMAEDHLSRHVCLTNGIIHDESERNPCYTLARDCLIAARALRNVNDRESLNTCTTDNNNATVS